MTDVLELSQRIIDGYRIKRGDDLSFFLTDDLDKLEAGAGKIQRHFRKNHVALCTIINGRSGRCPENCKYCAQSAHNKTGCEEYPFLPKEKILAETKDKFDRSINTIANDNGFSAKAQGKSAQKHNSLTRIMKEMIDSNFEECKVNAIDSNMKGVYKQMAEISNKNLFDQLNFQSDDYARMVAEQRSLLQKNDEKIMKLEEENRKLRIMVRQLGGEKFLGHVSPSDSDQTQTGGDR